MTCFQSLHGLTRIRTVNGTTTNRRLRASGWNCRYSRSDPCGGYFAISTCTPPDDYKAPQHDGTSQASWPEECVGQGDMGAATNRNGVMFIVKEWISFPTYKYKALPPAGYRLVIDRQYTEEDKWLEYGFVPASATPAPGLSAKLLLQENQLKPWRPLLLFQNQPWPQKSLPLRRPCPHRLRSPKAGPASWCPLIK